MVDTATDVEGSGARRPPFVGMTKAEYAYQAVRGQILDGGLRPGAIIDQESLSADLELSTTPVREALSRLAAEQLVYLRAHKRVQVAPLRRDELRHIYTVRIELEPFAAALGAELATDEERSHAKECLNLTGRTSIEVLRINRAFHRSMYQASHNEVLTNVIDSLADRADRYRMALIRSDDALSTATSEHEAIVAAFVAQRSTEVRRLWRDHLTEAQETIEQETSFGEDD